MEDVKMWLSSQAADFFDTGIQKLIPQYDKCLKSVGDYMRSSLRMYVYLYVIHFFLLLVLLKVHRILISE
jgi:hypothetical protein